MKEKPTTETAAPLARPARPESSAAKDPSSGTTRGPKRKLRRSMRDILESLSLAAQFRLVVVLSVALSIIVLHAVMSLFEVWSARQHAMRSAQQLTLALRGGPSAAGNAHMLDELADHPEVAAAVVTLSTGETVSRYVRSRAPEEADLDQSDGSDPPEPSATAPWSRRVGAALAISPTVMSTPIQLGPELTATVTVTLDPSTFWLAAVNELEELPLTLPIGLLIALLAANSLKRQIVEPLVQLASATRVSDWTQGTQQHAGPRRRNELTELASNFDVLADRLAEYERDLRNVRLVSARKIIEQTRDMEQRLRAAEAMTRAKDDFLANMSHEIRTPMNGVLGMAELLAGTKLDKRQQRFVDSMRTAAATMMQIINDILDDSKIEAGKMDLVRETFDVRGLMEDVGQLYAGAAERKKLELICRIESSVPRTVIGDVLRLRQVLGNLVSNAVKYTERGEVQIRVAEDQEEDGKCRLHFSVSDTGAGIPEDQQAAVFEAFTQLGNAARIGGTGLGLSIASRLVKLMGGGRIDLRSEVGRGSTFSFVAPFEVGQDVAATADESTEFPGLRVLLVDDNSSSYMQLEESLREWSADVTVVNRARVMLERLKSAAQRGSRFDVVLIDHSLPDMTSTEILRAIRTDPLTSSTYVVLMTALAFDPDQEGDRSIEPDACVPKPVRKDLLRRALQAAMDPSAAGSGAAGARAGAGSRGAASIVLGLDVLVVDDNAVNREVAVAMLEERRCKVAVAEDGHAAVKLARARRFDVILMDCQMPGMDGYAATAAIRREEAARGTNPTPIVALTANVLSKDRDRCIAAGMTSFLSKPFTTSQLVDALRPIAEASGKFQTIVPVENPTASAVSGDAVRAARPPAAPEPALQDSGVLDMLEAPLFALAPETARPSAAQGVTLDREQIDAIMSLGRPEVFSKLCELLYESAPAALQTIEKALAAGDLAAVANTAHSLKSSCANLGGRQLAAQLDRCETTARESGDISQVRSAAVGLSENYAALAAALARETARKTGTA